MKAVVDGTQVGDARLRSRSPERQRPRRSRSLSADAARVRSRGAAVGGLCVSSFALAGLVLRCCRRRLMAQQAPPPLVTSQELLDGLAGGRVALAHLWRQLRQPASQPADADYAGERQPPGAAVDVPDRHARQFRDHVAPARQRAVRHRAAERRVGARRANGAPDLALPPRAAAEPDRLLRSRQSRLRRARRQALHDHARCASAGARHEDRGDRLGRDHARTTRSATRRRSRRWS